MKKIGNYLLAIALGALLLPVAVQAQKENKEKDKDSKGSKGSKGVEQIIITRKGDRDNKVVVEINGDKITINGKPADEYKDGDITVNRNNFKELRSLVKSPRVGVTGWSDEGNGINLNGNFNFKEDENHAMLGVVTEKEEEGAKISEVSKESAAEKAGLKEEDIITKIDDTKIEDPDDLTRAIRAHKAGDKVTVTFLRDKKEQKITTELTKWKGMSFYSYSDKSPNFNFSMPDLGETMPRGEAAPRIEGDVYGRVWDAYNGRPKLGISVQDTDDGKGVKIINVDEESNAEKAGVKEEDIITSINDKEVNSADEVAKIVRENKDKPVIKIKLTRDGKTQNIDVKMPRKLKTADL